LVVDSVPGRRQARRDAWLAVSWELYARNFLTNGNLANGVSPIIGFGLSAILLVVLKFLVREPKLYEEPKGNEPPPLWIRAILIGFVPTAFDRDCLPAVRDPASGLLI